MFSLKILKFTKAPTAASRIGNPTKPSLNPTSGIWKLDNKFIPKRPHICVYQTNIEGKTNKQEDKG